MRVSRLIFLVLFALWVTEARHVERPGVANPRTTNPKLTYSRDRCLDGEDCEMDVAVPHRSKNSRRSARRKSFLSSSEMSYIKEGAQNAITGGVQDALKHFSQGKTSSEALAAGLSSAANGLYKHFLSDNEDKDFE